MEGVVEEGPWKTVGVWGKGSIGETVPWHNGYQRAEGEWQKGDGVIGGLGVVWDTQVYGEIGGSLRLAWRAAGGGGWLVAYGR